MSRRLFSCGECKGKMFALEIIHKVFEASKHQRPTQKDLNALRVAVCLAEKETAAYGKYERR